MKTRVQRPVAALILVLTMSACMTPPRPIENPRSYFAAARPRQVLVKLHDGKAMHVHGPRLQADTLWGFVLGAQHDEVLLPLSTISELQVRQRDKLRTGLLAGALVGAGLFAIIKVSGNGPPATYTKNGVQ